MNEFKYKDEEFLVTLQRDKDNFSASVNDNKYTGAVKYLSGNAVTFQVGANIFRAMVAPVEGGYHVLVNARQYFLPSAAEDDHDTSSEIGGHSGGRISVPMPGTIVRIMVKDGQAVTKDQPLVIIESMKMESPVIAPYEAVVKKIHGQPGDLIQLGEILVELSAPGNCVTE
ncbi:biotin/lipoyl-containing protein [Planctomycetota bacterium]